MMSGPFLNRLLQLSKKFTFTFKEVMNIFLIINTFCRNNEWALGSKRKHNVRQMKDENGTN